MTKVLDYDAEDVARLKEMWESLSERDHQTLKEDFPKGRPTLVSHTDLCEAYHALVDELRRDGILLTRFLVTFGDLNSRKEAHDAVRRFCEIHATLLEGVMPLTPKEHHEVLESHLMRCRRLARFASIT